MSGLFRGKDQEGARMLDYQRPQDVGILAVRVALVAAFVSLGSVALFWTTHVLNVWNPPENLGGLIFLAAASSPLIAILISIVCLLTCKGGLRRCEYSSMAIAIFSLMGFVFGFVWGVRAFR